LSIGLSGVTVDQLLSGDANVMRRMVAAQKETRDRVESGK